RNDDKYVDLAKDGEIEGSDIATNEVLENSDHNEPNIKHSEKDELDEQTVMLRVVRVGQHYAKGILGLRWLMAKAVFFSLSAVLLVE
ncbi:hypothetical protein Tco_0295441, partial [Tanacetum coccineum]